MITRFARLLLVSLLLSTCIASSQSATKKKAAAKIPTAAEAAKFVNDAEQKLSDLADKGQRADWVNENFITDDTDAISTAASNDVAAATTPLAIDANRDDSHFRILMKYMEQN